jgi:hypothetical protein
MKKVKKWHRFLLICIFCLAAVSGVNATDYNYPISDPYEATIVGTPDEFMPSLPKADDMNIRELEMDVFPDREIPEVFWYDSTMFYSLAWQEEKAPLIFVIAGTGARFDSPKNTDMQKAFYQAGFHVICLSSPTHPDFIPAASSSMLPGDIRTDCEDLYRVMKLAWEVVKDDIEVSDFYLTGYSLGGAQSAFVSLIDEQEKAFNFKKVLMINPPVSLYESATKLDKMLDNNIPGGLENFDAFYRRLISNISDSLKYGESMTLSPEFFYKDFQKIMPTIEEQKAVIGFSFRLSAVNLFFVSDVMTHSGFIVPKNLRLTKTTSTIDYGKAAARAGGFGYYAENVLFPAIQKKNPELTMDQMIFQTSLRSIEDYLRTAEKVSMLTNVDDCILAEGDVDYFKDVFASRAKIYPRGGHCGNMAYTDNVAYMVDFFKSEKKGN